jgi:hypothetical protein
LKTIAVVQIRTPWSKENIAGKQNSKKIHPVNKQHILVVKGNIPFKLEADVDKTGLGIPCTQAIVSGRSVWYHSGVSGQGSSSDVSVLCHK